MRSTVTVLVPTYNRESMLGECLESLLAQTWPPDQIIVMDDGSTDGTKEVVSNFKEVTYLYQSNGGKPRALNGCFPHIRGEFVWIFDDDDVALPWSVEHRAVLAQSTDADVVLSRHYWGHSGTDGRVVVDEEAIWPSLKIADVRLHLMQSCFTTLQGALIRWTALRSAGFFREELRTSEDYDMLLRLTRKGAVAMLDEPTFVFRRHEGMRGQRGYRYSSGERELRFARHDQVVGAWLRKEFALGEYLTPR
ncbi:MAG: glycosyltransferase family 2 protein [Betaproteobacteria bacterium]|nr:glycosyltransferase family 2 protein [Betaproteobacteria bacterium]